ncbi:MAG: tetratricopeptide repeat protein, partial [Nostoc sp.]
ASDDSIRVNELKFDIVHIYLIRGKAYSNKKDYSSAIADYTKAIKLQPDYADAYYLIYDDAKATQLKSEIADIYFYRGDAYLNQQNYDFAIADYTKVIELQPRYAEAYYNRGRAYLSKGDNQKARDNYKKVVELTDNSKLHQQAQQQLQKLEAK